MPSQKSLPSNLSNSLSSHLKTLPKPKSLRHVKILPETPAPRAAIFPLAFPLAGWGIVAPEPTVCAGFLTVGPAEADEGRGALGLEVPPAPRGARSRLR